MIFALDIVRGAIDRDGRIWLSYVDGTPTSGKALAVSLVWSSDGATWSIPLVVGADSTGGHSWLPAVASDGRGRIGVSYMEAVWPADSTAAVHPLRLRLAIVDPTASGAGPRVVSNSIEPHRHRGSVTPP